jgi:hypothetical protein
MRERNPMQAAPGRKLKMVAILQCSTAHCVGAIVLSMLTVKATCGQTIDFTWTSEGTFNGSPSAGTVLTMFSSSAPLDLTEFHASYTGQGGATRTFGPFEITAGNGDKLSGSFEIVGSGPIRLGMNFGSGTFSFTGGTGQFAGAAGEGTIDVKTTLSTFPTTTGAVEQEWRGMITLFPPTVPGDYNQNGTVDAADYVVWRKNDGTPAGYDTWRANFGATTATGAHAHVAESLRDSGPAVFATANLRSARLPYVSAVPEPTTVFIAAILLVFIPTCLLRERHR